MKYAPNDGILARASHAVASTPFEQRLRNAAASRGIAASALAVASSASRCPWMPGIVAHALCAAIGILGLPFLHLTLSMFRQWIGDIADRILQETGTQRRGLAFYGVLCAALLALCAVFYLPSRLCHYASVPPEPTIDDIILTFDNDPILRTRSPIFVTGPCNALYQPFFGIFAIGIFLHFAKEATRDEESLHEDHHISDPVYGYGFHRINTSDPVYLHR